MVVLSIRRCLRCLLFFPARHPLADNIQSPSLSLTLLHITALGVSPSDSPPQSPPSIFPSSLSLPPSLISSTTLSLSLSLQLRLVSLLLLPFHPSFPLFLPPNCACSDSSSGAWRRRHIRGEKRGGGAETRWSGEEKRASKWNCG